MRSLRAILPDLGIALITVAFSTYVFFFIAFAATGDEQKRRLGIKADATPVSAYIEWWTDVFNGNLGGRYQSDEMLRGQIIHGVGETFTLVAVASALSLVVGLAIAVGLITNRERLWAPVVEQIGYLSGAVPVFVLAMLVYSLLERHLSWITIGPGENVLRSPMPYVVAGGVLSIGSGVLGELIKTFGTEIGRIMNEPFILAARVRSANILLHAGKAAIVPLFSAVVAKIPYLIGASLIVEKVFGIHGLAELLETSASSGNFAKLMSVTLIIVLLVLGARLLNKTVVAIVDPRVT